MCPIRHHLLPLLLSWPHILEVCILALRPVKPSQYHRLSCSHPTATAATTTSVPCTATSSSASTGAATTCYKCTCSVLALLSLLPRVLRVMPRAAAVTFVTLSHWQPCTGGGVENL